MTRSSCSLQEWAFLHRISLLSYQRVRTKSVQQWGTGITVDISLTLRPECRTLMLAATSVFCFTFISKLRVLSHYQLIQIRAILGLSNSHLLMFWPFQFKVPTLLLFVRLKEREA